MTKSDDILTPLFTSYTYLTLNYIIILLVYNILLIKTVSNESMNE